MVALEKYSVLLLEDDLEDALLITEYLDSISECKFEITHCTTLKQCISTLESETFDIILTDMNVPDSMGVDTILQIKEVSIDTPFIVLTGFNDKATGLNILDIGAQDYLSKGTLDEHQLFQSIQYSISRKKIEEDLRHNRDLLRSIFNDTPLILFLVDQDRKIFKINKKGLDTIGVNEKDAIGLCGGELFNCLNHLNSPEGCGYGVNCEKCVLRNTVNLTLESGQVQHNVKATLSLLANGKTVKKHYMLSTSLIRTQNQNMVMVGLNDVSELEDAKLKIEKNRNRLEIQLRISDYKTQNAGELLDYCLEQALVLTESEIGFIALYDEYSQIFTIHSWSNSAMAICATKEIQTSYRQEETGIWTECVKTRKPFILNDFSNPNPILKGTPTGHVPLSRYLSIPVFNDNKIVAVVGLANKQYDYDETDSTQLTLLFESVWKNIDRQKLIEDLKIAKLKAEESDQLKSAFLANMSHEIRTPLNGILGFSELLKEPDLSTDEREEYYSIIESSSNRLLNIINDIMDLSKIESGQAPIVNTVVYVNDTIKYIHNLFQKESEKKGIQLIRFMGLEDEEATIQTDNQKLNAILINLVKNAIKYSKQGFIEFGYHRINNDLEFFIKDTGIGISKDRLRSIFGRFVRGDLTMSSDYEGAGLGLAITKAYVEMLGGIIGVNSEVGVGSRFWFTIPYRVIR